ncbi:hypothetical protein BHE74_00003033 [Ensete ventricosum]|uniref:Uncharacterized protein n=1 Tax=Ensete ventricosum TaxID=4639 RepID=A0A444FFT1_ENSVE|nr:hypothetical protein GW17_00014359 [Ensete ventricosum]RWW88101.1 hypothetical protein BHE74_00003033 [Ensete ventricosum]RZR71757.1 hypothetical protein BHM03_00007081 [Ensete ventricosum]
MIAAATEKASDGNNSSDGSCKQWPRGRRRIQMCPLVVLSLDSGRSDTRKQQQGRELRTKAKPSDSSIGDRGSVSSVRRRQRQRQSVDGRGNDSARVYGSRSWEVGGEGTGGEGWVLVGGAPRLVLGERPGGASLKHVAWRIYEALGPRLASPEHLGGRTGTYLNPYFYHPSSK